MNIESEVMQSVVLTINFIKEQVTLDLIEALKKNNTDITVTEMKKICESASDSIQRNFIKSSDNITNTVRKITKNNVSRKTTKKG